MLFAAVFVVIFSTAAVVLIVGMFVRRESILGLYAVIAALVAGVGAMTIASIKG